jgi:hypothetical protein
MGGLLLKTFGGKPRRAAGFQSHALLSNELPEKACHNRNSSYACDTAVFGNERLTLLVLTFGGCSDERHFKRFPVLIRTFGGCYEPHFKLFFDRRAGFMSTSTTIFAK